MVSQLKSYQMTLNEIRKRELSGEMCFTLDTNRSFTLILNSMNVPLLLYENKTRLHFECTLLLRTLQITTPLQLQTNFYKFAIC